MARIDLGKAGAGSLLILTLAGLATVLPPTPAVLGATGSAHGAEHRCHAQREVRAVRENSVRASATAIATCARRRHSNYARWDPQAVWAPVGRHPLSDAAAAALVVWRRGQRPRNDAANEYVPGAAELAAFHSEARGFSPLSVYVDGRDGLTKPSTDDLIQWTSVKWGIPTEWLRAQYFEESGWNQDAFGDRRVVSPEWWSLYPPLAQLPLDEVFETTGIAGVKWTPGPAGINPGTEPLRWRSTAFNMDYQASVIRYYFDGLCSWCTTGYSAGQRWNSIGAWDEPQPWRNGYAAGYLVKVKKIVSVKPWFTDPGL